MNTSYIEGNKEEISKNIIANLNTSGGTIYIGFKNKKLVGIKNLKETVLLIDDIIKNEITPDANMFININLSTQDTIDYLTLNVYKGNNIYYLKDKGIIKSSYIRKEEHIVTPNNEELKSLILEINPVTFELFTSNNQKLSFNYLNNNTNDKSYSIINNTIQRKLNIKNDKDLFTNLGLILSDQSPYSMKIVVYDKDETTVLDRKEIKGSILEIYDKTYLYLIENYNTFDLVDSEINDKDKVVIKEALVNSLVHRDYSCPIPNIIRIYKSRCIEFINYGNLLGNLKKEDIVGCLTVSRNPNLELLMHRFNKMTSSGLGLKKISHHFDKINKKIEIESLPTSLILRLPSITTREEVKTNDKLIKEYIKKNGMIDRKTAETIIHKEKTYTATLLNNMVKDNILEKIGNGPSTRYTLK